jgi:hypothetical protein
MSDIYERLMVLAGRARKKKYESDVENAYDELLEYTTDETDYSINDKVHRMLKRIKYALQAEGYKFVAKAVPAPKDISTNTALPNSSSDGTNPLHIQCKGSLFTLFKAKAPASVDHESYFKLREIFDKQCYKFDLSPAEGREKRNNGRNIVLPKPITWAKLQSEGLVIQSMFNSTGKLLLEEFRADGVSAYTYDRQCFYVANAGMCRRWVKAIDTMIAECVER